MQAAAAFEDHRADAFAEELLGILNGGALALMISFGHRAGLFDVMATCPAATCDEIASEAGLQEAGVRDWLGAMVAGRIVAYDAATEAYDLPPEHASVLTRRGRNQLPALSQWIPLLGAAEEAVLRAFEDGGGVETSIYPRLGAAMSALDEGGSLGCFQRDLLPCAPDLRAALARGIDVGVLSGRPGGELRRLADAFPHSRFRSVGSDPAGSEASSSDLVIAPRSLLSDPDPAASLSCVSRMLRTGGVVVLQHLGGSRNSDEGSEHPLAPLLHAISCLCMTPLSQRGPLPAHASMAGPDTVDALLRAAGFGAPRRFDAPAGGADAWILARLGDSRGLS